MLYNFNRVRKFTKYAAWVFVNFCHAYISIINVNMAANHEVNYQALPYTHILNACNNYTLAMGLFDCANLIVSYN